MSIRSVTILGIVAVAALAFSPVAEAKAKAKAKKKGGDLEAIFKKLDADKDGKLSPTEFAKVTEEFKKKKADAAAPAPAAKATKKAGKKTDALFTKLDTDKNGSLSLEEFKKVNEVRKEMKKAK